MHSRRLACFLLGMWLSGGVFLAFITRQNLRTADELVHQPSPALLLQFKPAGLTAARTLLRHMAGEQNRLYYESWELAQLVLGTFFFFYLLFGTREDKYSLALPLLMLMVVVVQRFVLTPEVVSLGRLTDFLPEGVRSGDRIRLLVTQSAYTAAELVKGGLGLILAMRLIFADWWRPSRRNVRQELDLVNKANYGHINR
jgi:hypothetical protein